MNVLKFVGFYAQDSLGNTSLSQRLQMTREQDEMVFLQSMTRSDLNSALKTATTIEKNQHVTSDIQLQLRYLFGLTCGYVVFVFYFATFSRAVARLVGETLDGRLFLATIPIMEISEKQREELILTFVPQGQDTF